MSYPLVLDEWKTLELVEGGLSLARFGDGEFKLALGHDCVSQPADKSLQARLRTILKDSGACGVGLPNLKAGGPKAGFWHRFAAGHQLRPLLNRDRQYLSAFMTRPDSAPTIDRQDYWLRIRGLWAGRSVTLVRGSEKSLTAAMLHDAAEVKEIIAPRQGAWANYHELLEQVGRPKRALLCLGPTATVMAVDLCALGVHAIDLGHIGMFLRKHERGDPMWVSKEEKAVDKPPRGLPSHA